MARLRHSAEGMKRTIRLTTKHLVVFVEGVDDRAFYSRLLTTIGAGDGLTFDIRLAREAGESSDCKAELERLYHRLKAGGQLLERPPLKPTPTGVLFLLDKDADDLHRPSKLIGSPHVVYTEMYNRENYVFRYSDLCYSIAVSFGLDENQVRAALANQDDWLHASASKWAEWMACCCMQIGLSRPVESFGVPSRVHAETTDLIDSDRLNAHLQKIATSNGLSVEQAKRRYRRHLRKVRTLAEERSIDRYFNGKWYSKFIRKLASLIAAGRHIAQCSDEVIVKTAEAKVDFSRVAAFVEPKIAPLLRRVR